MNKLAYDLALLCAEYSLKHIEPETCQESVHLVLETFKEAYKLLNDSCKPILDPFSEVN